MAPLGQHPRVPFNFSFFPPRPLQMEKKINQISSARGHWSGQSLSAPSMSNKNMQKRNIKKVPVGRSAEGSTSLSGSQPLFHERSKRGGHQQFKCFGRRLLSLCASYSVSESDCFQIAQYDHEYRLQFSRRFTCFKTLKQREYQITWGLLKA